MFIHGRASFIIQAWRSEGSGPALHRPSLPAGGSTTALAIALLLLASLAPLAAPASAQEVAVLIGPSPAPPVDIVVWLGGFQAFAAVEAWLVGDNIPETYLGTFYLDPNGQGLKVVGLPRNLEPGTYRVEFRVDGSTKAWVDVDVVRPVVALSSDAAAPGDVLTVSVSGLGGGGLRYTYVLAVNGIQLAVLVPDENGNASATIAVPPLPSGSYEVQLVYVPPLWLAQESVYGGPAVLASATLQVVNGVVTEAVVENLVTAKVQELIAPLQQDVEDLKQRVTSLEGAVAQLEDSVAQLSDAVQQLDQRLSQAEDRIEALQASVQELDQRLAQAEQALQALTGEVEALKQQLEEASRRIDGLEQRVSQLEDQAGQLDSRVTQLEDAVSQLRQQLDEVNARLAQAEASLESLSQRLSRAEQDLASALDRLASLEQRLGEAERRVSAVEQAQQALQDRVERLAELQAQLAEKVQEVDALKGQVGELRARTAALEQALDSLSKRLAADDERDAGQDERIAELEQRVAQLEQQLEEARRAAEEASGAASTARNVGAAAAVLALIGLAAAGAVAVRGLKGA